jgi:hypothetical protein
VSIANEAPDSNLAAQGDLQDNKQALPKKIRTSRFYVLEGLAD